MFQISNIYTIKFPFNKNFSFFRAIPLADSLHLILKHQTGHHGGRKYVEAEHQP